MKKTRTYVLLSVGCLVAVGLLLGACAPTLSTSAQAQQGASMQKSKQSKNGKFQNISPTPIMAGMSFSEKISLWSKFITGVKGTSPVHELPLVTHQKGELSAVPSQALKVMWFGHSAVLLELDGKRIFADPMLGQRASPVSFAGAKRFNQDLPIALDDLPLLDVVLLSHDHYDHLDQVSIKKLLAKTKQFLVPLGVAARLQKFGVPADKITEFDWWDTATVEGLFFAATPARHFSGRTLWDRDATLWASWVIKGADQTVFFGGDSGYDTHFKQIGDKYGPFDLTMLECGQYNQAWQYIHMMPEQTAQAHLDLKGRVLMPIHWAGFSLALHPWKEPIERLSKAAAQHRIQLATPLIGQFWQVEKELPQTQWWKGLE